MLGCLVGVQVRAQATDFLRVIALFQLLGVQAFDRLMKRVVDEMNDM